MGLRSVIVGTNTFIGGVEIIFDSRLVRDSRSFIQLNEPEYKRPVIIAFSREVLFLYMAQQGFLRRFIGKTEQPHFPAWHDSSLNCSTWTDAGGCKCEVEP